MSSITDRSAVRGSAPYGPGQTDPGGFRGIAELRVRGFRSIVDLTYAPGPLCALFGEARAGKSNLLAAVNALLDANAVLTVTDESTLVGSPILIEATLATGEHLSLAASGAEVSRAGDPPPVLYLPASERSTSLVAAEPTDPVASHALGLLRAALDERARGEALSDTLPAASLVDGLEDCCMLEIRGLVLLIEEPELFLRPQAQRDLYRLLRTFAQGGEPGPLLDALPQPPERRAARRAAVRYVQ